MEKIITDMEALAGRAAASDDAGEAMKFAQAATNLSHVMLALHTVRRHPPSDSAERQHQAS